MLRRHWALMLCLCLPILGGCASRSTPPALPGPGGPMVMPTTVPEDADGSTPVMTIQGGTVRMISNENHTVLRMPGMGPWNGIPVPFLRRARRIDAIDGRRENNPVLLLNAVTRGCANGGQNVLVVPKGNDLTIQEIGRCGRAMRLARSDGAIVAVDDETLETWMVRDGNITRLRGPSGENQNTNQQARPEPKVTRVEAPPVDIRTMIPEPGWAVAP